jgi:hypothetical protein
MWIFLEAHSNESFHLVFKGVKTFETTILYNDFEYNILALQGMANKCCYKSMMEKNLNNSTSKLYHHM